MAYVFGCTGGDAQTYLRLWYTEDSTDPFISEEEMMEHLSFIYKDLFKIQNARLGYKSLNIKTTETFLAF